jgi:hypothetical protein
MRKWLFLLLSFLFFVACKQDHHQKMIPKRDLVPLLVDLHIADAIALNHTINENFGRLDSSIMYGTILEKYGYTKEQLALTMEYYSGDVEKMTEIFDDVFSELSKQSEETKELYNSTRPSRTREIWKPENRSIKTKGDTVSYPGPFDIDIDTTGSFVISVDIKLNPQDKSLNPRIEAYFYDPQNDVPEDRIYFEETPVLKTFFTREYTLIREMNDPKLKKLKLTIPACDNKDPAFLKAIEMQDLRVALMQGNNNKPGKK